MEISDSYSSKNCDRILTIDISRKLDRKRNDMDNTTDDSPPYSSSSSPVSSPTSVMRQNLVISQDKLSKESFMSSESSKKGISQILDDITSTRVSNLNISLHLRISLS